jgi:hypothetical protein
MLITMEHIRAGGGCAWGLRTFLPATILTCRHFCVMAALIR